jgi:sugar/nucleoside kinase (ribokinase family)
MVDYVVVGNIIIDDIVLHDGRVRMNTLGGAGIHALMGLRVWSSEVGFIAGAGLDLPAEHRATLTKCGADLAGVRWEHLPTPRAWQLFEEDGRRTEVFRTQFKDLQRLEAQPQHFPPSYVGARGVYILTDRPDTLRSWVAHLRGHAVPVILWEPSSYWMEPGHRTEFARQVAEVDIVCPDMDAAACLYGESDPHRLVLAMHHDGARVVALRMGKAGSLVGEAGGETHAIPIWPAEVADVTGAGNAYCAGFLFGYAESSDVYAAGLHGAVSASFAVEQFGPIPWRADLAQEAQRRLGELSHSQGTYPTRQAFAP